MKTVILTNKGINNYNYTSTPSINLCKHPTGPCWTVRSDTVDRRNPAPLEVGSSPPLVTGFLLHPSYWTTNLKWLAGFLPSTVVCQSFRYHFEGFSPSFPRPKWMPCQHLRRRCHVDHVLFAAAVADHVHRYQIIRGQDLNGLGCSCDVNPRLRHPNWKGR